MPRASSATSGFFFWGSIELPVAKRSSSVAKPNSDVDQSTSSSPIRDRWTPSERDAEEELGDEVAVRDRVEAVLERRGEAQLAGGDRRVDRQRAAGERARPERGDVGARRGVHEPVRVSEERPGVRAEVVREQHRLGPLQVRVARAGRRRPPRRRGAASTPDEAEHGLGHRDDRLAGPESQVQGHLVVAAPRGVELLPDRAGELGHPPLDRGVDVLVGRREGERAAAELAPDVVERRGERRRLVLA